MRTKMFRALARKAPVLLLVAALLAAGPAVFTAAAQDDDQAAGYCRLKSDQDLWSGPSSNFRVLKRAGSGTLLEIIAQKGDYFRVRVPAGFRCYISAEFIAYGNDMIGSVTGSRVNLRSVPSFEGDYPLMKVDRGDTLRVWERKGDWVRVEAPPEAFAYILKGAVVPVQSTSEILMEADSQRLKGRRAWEDHVAGVSTGRQEAKKDADVRQTFQDLEDAASRKYAGQDLEETKAAYAEIRNESSDELVRKVAESRMSEIDALISEKKMEQDLKDREKRMRMREEQWRQELRRMEEDKAAGGKDKTASGPVPQLKGKAFLGRVDASGTTILLRGGRLKDEPLYYIVCPDKRYALEDFHGKRIAVTGKVEQMVTGELPRVKVERIEILR